MMAPWKTRFLETLQKLGEILGFSTGINKRRGRSAGGGGGGAERTEVRGVGNCFRGGSPHEVLPPPSLPPPLAPQDCPEIEKNHSRLKVWKKPFHPRTKFPISVEIFILGWNFHSRLKVSIPALFFCSQRGREGLGMKKPFSIEKFIPYWKLDFSRLSLEIDFC